jgi:hypothetical protein
MLIHVTQDHIDHGSKGSCTADPVCLALEDSGFYAAWVSPSFIQTKGKKGDLYRAHPVPDEVLEFMKQFDNDQMVYPFEFELEG